MKAKTRKTPIKSVNNSRADNGRKMVRIAGLEPARVTPLPPQSSVSANSTICAQPFPNEPAGPQFCKNKLGVFTAVCGTYSDLAHKPVCTMGQVGGMVAPLFGSGARQCLERQMRSLGIGCASNHSGVTLCVARDHFVEPDIHIILLAG